MFKVKKGCLAHTHTLQSQENSPHLLSNLHDFFFPFTLFSFFCFSFKLINKKGFAYYNDFVFEIKSNNFEF